MTKDSVNIAARAYLILVVLVVEDGASIFRTTVSVSKNQKEEKSNNRQGKYLSK